MTYRVIYSKAGYISIPMAAHHETLAEAQQMAAQFERAGYLVDIWEDGEDYSRQVPFASSVRRARNARAMTQAELAAAAGINLRQLQKIESGEIKAENLTLKNALALAAALGVEPEDLI